MKYLSSSMFLAFTRKILRNELICFSEQVSTTVTSGNKQYIKTLGPESTFMISTGGSSFRQARGPQERSGGLPRVQLLVTKPGGWSPGLGVTATKVTLLPLGENIAHSVNHWTLKRKRFFSRKEKIECWLMFTAVYLYSSHPEHTPRDGIIPENPAYKWHHTSSD